MTNDEIPDAAAQAAATVMHAQDCGGEDCSHVSRDIYLRDARLVLAAALPHLRPMLELAGNLGRELGRREAAEEIAQALEAEALSDYDAADDLRWAAAKAREITATKEPADKPEASRTRCSHCGFYRPSLLNHHPECPHAATKEPK